MSEKPHIVRIVADEARRQYYRCHRSRAELPKPRICENEIGVEFDDGRFIPYADLGYHDEVGFFRLSEATERSSQAAPFAAVGRLIDCGQIVVTTGMAQRLTHEEIRDVLERHSGGDFGVYGEFYDLDVDDAMLLDEAGQPLSPGLANKVNTLTGLNPIVSAYTVREHAVWVITEAGEKRTTILLYAGAAD
jgi:hypothetical protein